jgi:hypothetical protein
VPEPFSFAFFSIGSVSHSEHDDQPLPKRPSLDPSGYDDEAKFVNSRRLTSNERYNLITNHYRPPQGHSFPKVATQKGRSFQQRWLELFPWLVYSKHANGVIAFNVCFLQQLVITEVIQVFLLAVLLLHSTKL